MKTNLSTIIRNFYKINLKTIRFNFRYFDFKTAIKFPVLLHRKTKILSHKGRISLPENPRFGLIRFGYGGSVFDLKNQNSVWQLKGEIIFKGSASFGNGTIVSALENSKIIIGNNFSCGSNSKILCRTKIEFGNDALLSWNVTLMDTDFHTIFNVNNEAINLPKSIIIEDKVWIGSNATILKGVTISQGSIIASNTTVSKSITSANAITASNPQQIIKENINWKA